MEAISDQPRETQGSHPITPEAVRELPLHEVTAQYGTLGLYTRLEDSLQREGLYEIPEVQWAVQFGLMLHGDDKRTNGEYTDHLMRVMLRLVDHYEVRDPDLIIAAALHDSVEDHAKDIVRILGDEDEDITGEATVRERAFELLTEYVGEAPVELIKGVTNPLVAEGEDKQAVYESHFKEVILPDPRKRLLKLGDFTDNGVGNHYTQGDKQAKLDRKYDPMYRLHSMGLFMPDSLLKGDIRNKALRQLAEARARGLARLATAAS